MATHTAVVRQDGTILIPIQEALPGETVTISIEPESRATPIAEPGDETYLTILTADTPEKRELLVQQVLEWGRRNRAQMTEEELNFDWDAWMYDENGLPH